MAEEEDTVHYDGAEGGWGSVRGIVETALARTADARRALDTLRRQNKVKGFMCVSCAWTKPAHPHAFEFCENGAKATLVGTDHAPLHARILRAAYASPNCKTWKDYDLEQQGRLTHPLRYDRATRPICARAAGTRRSPRSARELKAIDPGAAVFYASGRASLETSYLYALFARLYGHNNLPDSSNMCHETTSVALKKVIGSPVGTCVLDDFDLCDAIFFFGQNPGPNSPRLLHPLQEAVKRGCKIVTFNPIREKGLEVFKNPQSPIEMLTPQGDADLDAVPAGEGGRRHRGDHRHDQARPRRRGAEVARGEAPRPRRRFHRAAHRRLRGDEGRTPTRPAGTRSSDESGLAARRHRGSRRRSTSRRTRSIAMYGMGLTQHVHGFDNLADAHQPVAAEGQYRPRRRRHLAGARPFQRAGPAHRRHLREARTGPARQARRAIRLRAAARGRAEHRQGVREDRLGRGEGVHRPRRQLRPRDPRARADGGGLGASCA